MSQGGRAQDESRVAATEYYEVLVNDARASQIYRLSAGRFPAKIFGRSYSVRVPR